jgi:hypothetical protein
MFGAQWCKHRAQEEAQVAGTIVVHQGYESQQLQKQIFTRVVIQKYFNM